MARARRGGGDGGTFLASVTLETVGAYPDGGVEFLFDDGGLFFGHAILASGDVETGIVETQIAG